METRARYALIGAFMLAVIAASFAFVYWLENKGGFGERTSYRLRFDSVVSGLQSGSAVLFNGIRVGEVTGLGFDPDHPNQVIATIGVVRGVPIRSDTVVGIEFARTDRRGGGDAHRRRCLKSAGGGRERRAAGPHGRAWCG